MFSFETLPARVIVYPMYSRIRYLTGFFTVAFAVFLFSASEVPGHPHAWIDLRSTVLLDEDGFIIAIEQEWLFDEFYTVFATEQIVQDPANLSDALTELTRNNLNNLKEFNYFTEVRAGEEMILPGTVTEFVSEIRGDNLWMRFVMPLEKPVDPVAHPVSFAVYDPSYYAEILYLEGDVVAFKGPALQTCSGLIHGSEPTMEAILLAQSVDLDVTPDTTLGRIFAEWVDISCEGT